LLGRSYHILWMLCLLVQHTLRFPPRDRIGYFYYE
jgi:hypothetical protein